ncbi:Amidohydrolase [Balamuthia mandrillaris]
MEHAQKLTTVAGVFVPTAFLKKQQTSNDGEAENKNYEVVNVVLDAEKGTIAQVGSPDAVPVVGTKIDGKNKLLLPGFVNAHTHSSEMWVRGEIDMLPLELWLASLSDFAPADTEHVYLSCLHNAMETIASGGTCVVDHLSPIPGRLVESVEAAVRAYKEIGIRACIAPLIGDLPLECSFPSEPGKEPKQFVPAISTENLLRDMETAIQRFHQPEQGIYMMVGPTGLQLCTDELIKGCIALSEKYSLARHIHCLETKAQVKLAHEKYGCSAVEHLRDLQFLGPRTSCAHCVWLDEKDIQIFKETETTAVHNALSNIRLGSGIAPVLKYRDAGVNVAMGCDGAASNDSQDLLEAIKIGTLLHNVTEFDYRKWLKPIDSLVMAALGGATGLGLQNELGTIEEGKKADLVLFDLEHSLSLLPRTDIVGLLVMGRPTPDAVHSVWVNGKRVLAQHNIFTTIDREALRQKIFEKSQWKLTPRASETRNALESGYRAAMGLPSCERKE